MLRKAWLLVGLLMATPAQAETWFCSATNPTGGAPGVLRFEVFGAELRETTSDKLLKEFLDKSQTAFVGETYDIIRNDAKVLAAQSFSLEDETDGHIVSSLVVVTKANGAFLAVTTVGLGAVPDISNFEHGNCTAGDG